MRVHTRPTFGTQYIVQVQPSDDPNTEYRFVFPKHLLAPDSKDQFQYHVEGQPGEGRTLTYNTDGVTHPGDRQLLDNQIEATLEANITQIDEYTIQPHPQR